VDQLLIALRIVHEVFGVFWVGTAFFVTLFLEPRLRGLGPAIQGAVMRALMPVLSPAMLIAAMLTIGAGTAMAILLRRFMLSAFFSSGWGWAMLIGFVTAMCAFTIGLALITPTGLRMDKLGRGMAGRAPKPEELREMEGLSRKLSTLSRADMVLVLVAVGAMAVSRYV
jgi:hypothetical protein